MPFSASGCKISMEEKDNALFCRGPARRGMNHPKSGCLSKRPYCITCVFRGFATACKREIQEDFQGWFLGSGLRMRVVEQSSKVFEMIRYLC